MSAGPDPMRVMTLDGAVWVRAAVTRAGLGLYCPEGVVSCPRFVMATLAELAEHGVKAAPPVTDLSDAVALMGALPMPVGESMRVELSDEQLEALSAAGNRALNDHYHEDLCYCRSWPASCESSGGYFMGTWDTAAFAIGLPSVLGVWETLRNDRHAAKNAELRVENEHLRARVAELESATARQKRPVLACEACGDLPEKWCPDCAACKAGCFGGHDGNQCTHPNTGWAVPAPIEDPHDSPLHHTYALGRDLPEVTPDPSRDESVSKLRALLSRQSGGDS